MDFEQLLRDADPARERRIPDGDPAGARRITAAPARRFHAGVLPIVGAALVTIAIAGLALTLHSGAHKHRAGPLHRPAAGSPTVF